MAGVDRIGPQRCALQHRCFLLDECLYKMHYWLPGPCSSSLNPHHAAFKWAHQLLSRFTVAYIEEGSCPTHGDYLGYMYDPAALVKISYPVFHGTKFIFADSHIHSSPTEGILLHCLFNCCWQKPVEICHHLLLLSYFYWRSPHGLSYSWISVRKYPSQSSVHITRRTSMKQHFPPPFCKLRQVLCNFPHEIQDYPHPTVYD